MSQATNAPFSLPLPRPPHLSLLQLLGTWQRRSAGRATLARLDRRALKDIGISPFEAQIECAKPFWRM